MLAGDPELAVAYGIFTARQARDAGYSDADIRRNLRRGRWMRSGRGQLEVVGRERQATDELVRAWLSAGPQAVVGFETAAALHGWELPRSPKQALFLRPANATSGSGYRARLAREDVMLCGIIVVTTPARTALDIAAVRPFRTAVIVLDAALRSGQVSHNELCDRFALSSRIGVASARRALASADPQSGSVAESEARLLFAEAGLPSPRSQCLVRSAGRIARLDFAWEEAKLAVEIDGFAYHSAAGDFQRDRTRQNAVQLEGWLVLRFTVADIRDRPADVVAQIRQGLARPLPRP